MMPDVKPELKDMIAKIASRSMFGGRKIPASVMAMFVIEETDTNCGVLVPYWIAVFQKGRGPRKGNKDFGLWKIIYKWMEKHSMFKSAKPEGKISEAKSMTWYINKYGNQHFRSQQFIDIYETARKEAIVVIENKFAGVIDKITMDVI